jgi:hypothetical protein
MSGAQANTGGRGPAHQRRAVLPTSSILLLRSVPLVPHNARLFLFHRNRVMRVNLLSLRSRMDLSHSLTYMPRSAFNDVCFLVTLTQPLLSCQLHSYDSTAWCANLNCVHSSISFYRRTSKCCLVVDYNYRSDRAAPNLILRSSVHVSPRCYYWPPTLPVSRPGAQTN